LRKKSWVWDIDDIYAQNVAPNVLDLLSAKMAHLSQNVQVSGVFTLNALFRIIR
jgi:hypothetical protein